MSSSSFSLLCFFLLHLLLPPCCSCCAQHLLHSANSSHPNTSIAHLLDAGSGNVTDGLKRYLARFGYVSDHSANGSDDGGQLVKLYQSTLGLPVTGRLDNVTLDLLATPRCGVPDLRASARFAFFAGQPRWARTAKHFLLTYAVITSPPAGEGITTNQLPPPKAVRAAFRRAFARWARVIPVRFIETKNYNTADVRIGFFAGDHGDGEPFDGPLGVLGHAFSPPSGQLHLDAAERWAVRADRDGDPGAVDLESVATHEIGHVLGLAHSSAPEAIMYPSLKPRTRKVDLTADDVRGVQALYGSNPRFSLSSLSEPDTSHAAATVRSPGTPTATYTVTLLCLVAITLLLC